MKTRLLPTLDWFLGLTLSLSLAMAAFTALPGAAHAADAVVIGDGKAGTEHRGLSEFNALNVSGNFEVLVRQGAQASVDLRADTNLLPLIETVVDGKSLRIRWKPRTSVQTRTTPTIQVTVVQLQALASSGSSKLRVDGLKTPKLAAAISGSGDIRIEQLQAEQAELAISGSGDLLASGQVSKLALEIAGSGSVKTDGLKADDVSISIAGSGNASVHADKTLKVSIAGSGDVRYSGGATVRQSIAGSGSVHKR